MPRNVNNILERRSLGRICVLGRGFGCFRRVRVANRNLKEGRVRFYPAKITKSADLLCSVQLLDRRKKVYL
jgi:hypothetical protein